MRALVLSLAVVAAVGCGGKAAEQPAAKTPAMSPDERAIRQTLSRYVDAVRANDVHATCELTAQEVLDKLKALGGTCEEAFASQVAKGGPHYSITITSVTIKGDRAMARGNAVEGGKPRDGGSPMVREHGRWLMTLDMP
jgi:ketosteroid isomerase-like protein